MANGNALIAALRSATPQGITTAPGESTSFEAPWTNVSRRSLSDVLNAETPFMPVTSWRNTANLGPSFSGYTDPNYTPPGGDGGGPPPPPPPPAPTPSGPDIGKYESVAPGFWDDLNAEYADQYSAFRGSDQDWVDSNQFRNYQSRVLGGIENTYDTDKLQSDIAFFNTQLDDPIYGANARMLRDAQEAQLAKISAFGNDFDPIDFY